MELLIWSGECLFKSFMGVESDILLGGQGRGVSTMDSEKVKAAFIPFSLTLLGPWAFDNYVVLSCEGVGTYIFLAGDIHNEGNPQVCLD